MLFQKLHKWQTDHGLSDTALAEKVGVTQSAISRAKRGLRVLGMEHQLTVQEVTGNKVLPADWAEFFAVTVHLRAQKKSALASEVA